MDKLKDKKIYFSGKGEYISKVELEKYLITFGVKFVPSLQDAEVIIEGNLTPPNISSKIFKYQQNGIKVITIEELEKEFSKNLNIKNILMAIKLTKNNDRLIELLKNSYFDDNTFLQLLKQYRWSVQELYEDDESRDICKAITSRFCSLINKNHNIQYAPIGIYYTALETSSCELLEFIYNMPDYKISDKNIKQNQPLTLKEVVALNPNSSKSLHIEILENQNIKELEFLALNHHIDIEIKERLKLLKLDTITQKLIIAQNYICDDIQEVIDNKNIQNYFLKYYFFDDKLFSEVLSLLTTDTQKIYLSMNNFLTENMLSDIEGLNITNATINILKNKLISSDIKVKYFKLDDKIYNISLAHNENLTKDEFYILWDKNDLDINISLASNISTPKEILQKLYDTNQRFIHTVLCNNISTPIQILMQLQLDNELKILVKENPTYQAFAQKMLGYME